MATAPEHIETDRLVLRRPGPRDLEAIQARYAGDAEVVKYIGGPRHRSPDDTRAFLEFSASAWRTWLAGPYLDASGPSDMHLFLCQHRARSAATGVALSGPVAGPVESAAR